MPETKSHQRLRSRVQFLRTHLELSDLAIRLLLNSAAKCEDQSESISAGLDLDCNRYVEMDHPIGELDRLSAFSRSKNAEFALIAIFTYFSEYLAGILSEMFHFDPLLVVGKAVGNQSLTFPEIVKLGTREAVEAHMVSTVFRTLENERSTKKLLERILANTNSNISEAVKSSALGFLEMRHIFIHRAGIADDIFVLNHGAQFGIAIGDKLPTDFATARASMDATLALCDAVDAELLRTNHVQSWQTTIKP
jgi:hypothetical protein